MITLSFNTILLSKSIFNLTRHCLKVRGPVTGLHTDFDLGLFVNFKNILIQNQNLLCIIYMLPTYNHIQQGIEFSYNLYNHC